MAKLFVNYDNLNYQNFLYDSDPVSPTFSLDLPRQVTVPSTSKFNLTCQASGIPLPTITWFKNGSPLLHSPISTVKGHSLLRYESIKREDKGDYWCEAINFAGWKRSSTATLTGKYYHFCITDMSSASEER